MGKVSAIILAAGEGRRMGALKQLLPLGDSTILEKTVDNITASTVDETVVVLGYRSEEIKARLAEKPVKVVVNPEFKAGMSTSIAAGVKAVSAGTEAVLIVLADQPFITTSLIDSLINEYKNQNKGIIIPIFQGRRGHPVIFSLRYKAELLALNGDIGAREVISNHAEDILEVEVDSRSIALDIDTPEDYQALKEE